MVEKKGPKFDGPPEAVALTMVAAPAAVQVAKTAVSKHKKSKGKHR